MEHFLFHTEVGRELVAPTIVAIAAGLILAIIGLAWAWWWKKRSKLLARFLQLDLQRDQQVQDIHNKIFSNEVDDERH